MSKQQDQFEIAYGNTRGMDPEAIKASRNPAGGYFNHGLNSAWQGWLLARNESQASPGDTVAIEFTKLAAWRDSVGQLFNDYGDCTGMHHVAGGKVWNEIQLLLVDAGKNEIYDGELPGDYDSRTPLPRGWVPDWMVRSRLIRAIRQFRHNNDNSPDLSNPKGGFVIAYDKEEIDRLVSDLTTSACKGDGQ